MQVGKNDTNAPGRKDRNFGVPRRGGEKKRRSLKRQAMSSPEKRRKLRGRSKTPRDRKGEQGHQTFWEKRKGHLGTS